MGYLSKDDQEMYEAGKGLLNDSACARAWSDDCSCGSDAWDESYPSDSKIVTVQVKMKFVEPVDSDMVVNQLNRILNVSLKRPFENIELYRMEVVRITAKDE